jgi:hypothetical protein
MQQCSINGHQSRRHVAVSAVHISTFIQAIFLLSSLTNVWLQMQCGISGVFRYREALIWWPLWTMWWTTYRGADKSLVRPTSRCILFDGENISFDASLVLYIYIYTHTHTHIYIYIHIYIQGVPGGKVNILGGHSIGHSKQKTWYEHVSYSERFPR